MLPNPRPASFAALLLAAVVGSQVQATVPNTAESAENSMRQFVAKGDAVHPYKAARRLEARQGDRRLARSGHRLRSGDRVPLHHHR